MGKERAVKQQYEKSLRAIHCLQLVMLWIGKNYIVREGTLKHKREFAEG